MNRKHLYLIAAIIWGIPGVIIPVKGISAYGLGKKTSARKAALSLHPGYWGRS